MQLRILRTYFNAPAGDMWNTPVGAQYPTMRTFRDTLQYLDYYEGQEVWKDVPVVVEHEDTPHSHSPHQLQFRDYLSEWINNAN